MGRFHIIYVFFLGFVAVLNTVYGVALSYDKTCYSVSETMKLTAFYTGNGSVTAVEWYYSGKEDSNLIIIASTCRIFGALDAGYPDESRMSFTCSPTINSFTLTVAELLSDELDKSWGATFHLFAGLSPPVVKQFIIYCRSGTTITTRNHFTTTSAKTISSWNHGKR
ncbi:uncharacterized protein LOC132753500 [Ruditapes philippinarum]|uniref:uncharacterized protein LOC132753500 n=1 Tax=Ruditapes philippinarum TaxID=129788 RepID=UPI00295B2CF9|nr:uncharacterized protein LOC132753500 [Ruditapes philippinarum]